MWMDLPPGPCTATAELQGSDGWLDSADGPVEFVVPSFSRLVVLASTAEGPASGDQSRAGVPLTFTATVSGTNGVNPTGGTLRLTDVDAGTVLASAAVTPTSQTLIVDTEPLAPGRHPFRAEYSGDETILGATEDVVMTIDGDVPERINRHR
jgi:hypothetical protein